MSHTVTTTQILENGDWTVRNVSQSENQLVCIEPMVTRDHGHWLDVRNSTCANLVESSLRPSTTVFAVERWNKPKVNACRLLATLFAFIIMGANDAAYGAIIPYLEEYYGLTYLVVSLIFLSSLGGYVGAALLNNWLHIHFGQRGIAIIGPICHIAAYIGITTHPPYPVLVALFIFAGFGNGVIDAGWNAWAGSIANANEILGLLHGFYGLGAVLSPMTATSLMTKNGWQWHQFYYIMLGGAIIELATSSPAFWSLSGRVYCERNPKTNTSNKGRLLQALKHRVTWVASLFLLCYIGTGIAIGGWIVTFMRRERSGRDFESGVVATGFWTGIAVGRLVLGFATPKIGEKLAVLMYIVAAMISQLVFWLVPSFHVSAISVALQGVFLGPLFPAMIVATTKVLPSYLHVSAIGFAAACGGIGGAAIPFAIGALAQAKGVNVLQPIILAVLTVLLLLWICLPRLEKTRTGDDVSPSTQEYQRKKWFHFDFDIIETARSTLRKP